MGDRIEVDFDSLATAIDDMRASAASLQATLDTMDRDLAGIDWEGAAATAFQEARMDWSGSMNDVQIWLRRCADTLSGVSARYDATEASVVRECGG